MLQVQQDMYFEYGKKGRYVDLISDLKSLGVTDENLRNVDLMVRKLPDRKRYYIEAYYYNHKSIVDIHFELGYPMARVNTALRGSVKRLAELLNK